MLLKTVFKILGAGIAGLGIGVALAPKDTKVEFNEEESSGDENLNEPLYRINIEKM